MLRGRKAPGILFLSGKATEVSLPISRGFVYHTEHKEGDSMDAFGKKVRELRTAAGLSQEKLAEQLRITEKTVQRYEKGLRPDTYGLAKLASFFNVSADYLLGLKGYEQQMLERESRLRGAKGYSKLYAHYLKCLNDYEITEDTDYYWIELGDDFMGGQTQWVGWADKEHRLELRTLRPVKPREAVALCEKVSGKPMVLNSRLDAEVFRIYGGQAIVREDICKAWLPEFLEAAVTENPELAALRRYDRRHGHP